MPNLWSNWLWINTYRYSLSGDEHPFTSYFDVHLGPSPTEEFWPFQWPFIPGSDWLEVHGPYIRPIFEAYVREYPQKFWPYMVQYLHFRILTFPLIFVVSQKRIAEYRFKVIVWKHMFSLFTLFLIWISTNLAVSDVFGSVKKTLQLGSSEDTKVVAAFCCNKLLSRSACPDGKPRNMEIPEIRRRHVSQDLPRPT